MELGIWAIGAVLAAIGGAIVAFHRTRGARRSLAADATEKAMEQLASTGVPLRDPVRLRAELFIFYYKTIVGTEGSPPPRLFGGTVRDVLERYYPQSLRGVLQSQEVEADGNE